MNEIKNNIKKGFTVIPNDLVNDNSISPQARFLFVYMASKPDDWRFYQSSLADDMGWSLDTLRKYQVELIRTGWIGREQNRKEREKFDGFDYTLHASPCMNFSDTVKTRSGKNPQRKNSVLTKEVLNTKKEFEQINNPTTTREHSDFFKLKDSEISFSDPDAGIKCAGSMAEYFKTEGRAQWLAMDGPDDDAAIDSVTWDWANSEKNMSLVPFWRRHVGKLRTWISSYKAKKHGNETTTNYRNGGIPQQRKVNAHPTTEELKRKYNLL